MDTLDNCTVLGRPIGEWLELVGLLILIVSIYVR